MYAVADFCLIPVGVESSVTRYIAECQRVLEKSGLQYELHGYGTKCQLEFSTGDHNAHHRHSLEGEWDLVSAAIRDCHEAVHALGCPRVATDIRIGTRTDKKSSNQHKRQAVVDALARDRQDPSVGRQSTSG